MANDQGAATVYAFRVEGIEDGHRSYDKPFDETYEIEGEHPAEALMKLVNGEIEWGILDGDRGFTITFIPTEDDDGDA